MPDKAQPTVLLLPWGTKPYHSYYVQLVFLSSLSNYMWWPFFLMKYAYNTSSLPISHCMDKIISLYHVWGDQWQAKPIAEPTMCLVGTLRSLWGQQLVIWLVICKRYMKHSQASRGWSVVYCRKFDGSFHGERSRMTLGLISPAENRQMRLKQLSVFVHMQPEVQGRASRTPSMGAGINYKDG